MPMAKFCHIPFCQGKESGLLCGTKNAKHLKNPAKKLSCAKKILILHKNCKIAERLRISVYRLNSKKEILWLVTY